MKNLFRHILLMTVAAFFVQPALAAEEITVKLVANPNSVQYTDDMWSEEFNGLEKQRPVYISADHKFNVPPPPANDSAETMEELKTLLRYQRDERTPENLAKIKKEERGTADMVFALGKKVEDGALLKVEDVRAKATQDLHRFMYQIKREYHRARPTQLTSDLTTVLDIPKGPAYPSGHAGIAYLGALVYSYIDPANKDEYIRLAKEVGVRRQIAGLHYPSDVAAAQNLAEQIYAELLKNADYKKLLDEAKTAYQNSVLTGEPIANISPDIAPTDPAYKDLRFLEEKWDPALLADIKNGPKYIDPKAEFKIPQYPANDNPETLAELNMLRYYQANLRTPENIQKILDENGRSKDLLQGGPLIRQFDDVPTAHKLWGEMYRDVTWQIMVQKQKYMRARPTQLAHDLTTLVSIPGHPAYPSGHGTQSRVIARLLGDIDPKNAKVYIKMSDDITKGREIAGLHYPTDGKAGHILADQIYVELMKNPELQKMLEQAKKEFAARPTN